MDTLNGPSVPVPRGDRRVQPRVPGSIPAASVIEVLERLREERGLPERVICDNGSEFTSRAFDAWAYSRDLKIEYQPGKPIQLLRELPRELQVPWFLSLRDASSNAGGRTEPVNASETLLGIN